MGHKPAETPSGGFAIGDLPIGGRRAAGVGQYAARARRQGAWAAGVSPRGRLGADGAGVGVGAGRRVATPGQRRIIPALRNGFHIFALLWVWNSEWRWDDGGRRQSNGGGPGGVMSFSLRWLLHLV